MTEAKKDNNQIPVSLATSNADGETPVLFEANPTNHGLTVEDNTTGSDLSDDIASRDNNGIPVAMAVSEADGVTPVAIYADSSSGALLVDHL